MFLHPQKREDRAWCIRLGRGGVAPAWPQTLLNHGLAFRRSPESRDSPMPRRAAGIQHDQTGHQGGDERNPSGHRKSKLWRQERTNKLGLVGGRKIAARRARVAQSDAGKGRWPACTRRRRANRVRPPRHGRRKHEPYSILTGRELAVPDGRNRVNP